ncbi:MAG: hypothetical protein ISR99_00185 [Parcubacteria group bacterium]|nr:hypothetical protein [Parcubacteria group bacterium]
MFRILGLLVAAFVAVAGISTVSVAVGVFGSDREVIPKYVGFFFDLDVGQGGSKECDTSSLSLRSTGRYNSEIGKNPDAVVLCVLADEKKEFETAFIVWRVDNSQRGRKSADLAIVKGWTKETFDNTAVVKSNGLVVEVRNYSSVTIGLHSKRASTATFYMPGTPYEFMVAVYTGIDYTVVDGLSRPPETKPVLMRIIQNIFTARALSKGIAKAIQPLQQPVVAELPPRQ